MTRRELYAGQRGLMLGTICGVFATCAAGAGVTLALRALTEETLYLALVGGLIVAGIALSAAAAWVTWRALAWARGGSR